VVPVERATLIPKAAPRPVVTGTASNGLLLVTDDDDDDDDEEDDEEEEEEDEEDDGPDGSFLLVPAVVLLVLCSLIFGSADDDEEWPPDASAPTLLVFALSPLPRRLECREFDLKFILLQLRTQIVSFNSWVRTCECVYLVMRAATEIYFYEV
jgi:hypothetical protein